jgi:hypothetical protein
VAHACPSADTVALAIVAASRITGADPCAVARGEVSRGRGGYEVTRARAYAALALRQFDNRIPPKVISKLVGTKASSAPCYLGTLEFQQRQGEMKWLDRSALARIVGYLRGEHPAPLPAPTPVPVKAVVATIPVPSKVVAKPAPAKAREQGRIFTLDGISVDFTEGDERLIFGGKEKTISPRQALLFEALAKGMPNPIGRDFLRLRLFGQGGSTTHKDVQLDLVAGDARSAARAVGLNINELKGIGFSLVKQ